MTTVKKLITLRQLQDALGERLPCRPDYRRMMTAISRGMPCVESPMLGGTTRAHYLFDLDACLAWWFPAPPNHPVPPDRSAINAALSVNRRRRPRAV